VVLFALVGGIAAAFWYFSHDATVRRELRKAPLRRIADLAEGERARIVGGVKPFERTLTSPLSGRPCVLYTVLVQRRVQSGKNSRWKTVIDDQQGVPFIVDDDSGRAIVDPTNARISLETDTRTRSGTFDDPTPAEQAYLASHGVSGQGWVFNNTMRYIEAVVEEHEVIAVLGAGVREPDPDARPSGGEYRSEMPTRLRLTSSAQHPLVISDAEGTTRT